MCWIMKARGRGTNPVWWRKTSSNSPKSKSDANNQLFGVDRRSKQQHWIEICCERLSSSMENHLKILGLRHMPANMKEISTQKFVTAPNKDRWLKKTNVYWFIDWILIWICWCALATCLWGWKTMHHPFLSLMALGGKLVSSNSYIMFH